MKMKLKLFRRSTNLVVLIALIAGSVVPALGAQKRRKPRARKPAVVYYTVAANSIIRVRLNEELNSKTARIGDRFSSTVTDPVNSSGVEVIPVESKVWGRVTAVTRAGRRTPGSITVSFNSIALPNGRTAVINGSLTNAQSDDANADNESTVKGTSNRKRDVVFIGGGAAGGALIGAIAGGGKGAGIGAIIGGALGTGARVYEKEKDAEVKSGTEFGVILNQSVRLPASSVR